MRKLAGDIITLHRCTKNQDHMMYASWDMECDRHDFVIQGHFLPLNPLITQKIKFLEKCLGISSFHSCVPKMTIIWCMVPEIGSMTDNIFCHLWTIFSFYPNSPVNQNFGKMKKKKQHLEILSFYTCVP